jgi:hypothetical protein
MWHPREYATMAYRWPHHCDETKLQNFARKKKEKRKAMSKDNSPNAYEWIEKEYLNHLLSQVKSTSTTCREMWLACSNPWMLYTITYHLKSWPDYDQVRVWFVSTTRYGTAEEADLFRAKCKELVWDKRKK